MIKRKGQMVPRWLVKANEKKSQHLFKFGCDVEVINKKIIAIGEGSVFIIPPDKYCNLKKHKGKTKRRVKGFTFADIYIDTSNQEQPNSAFKVECEMVFPFSTPFIA